jgi:DNA excision repair protein ERCC-3
VSTNTQEMFYADKRQQFLVDQGFFFEVIQSLPFMNDPEEKKKLFMNDIHEQTNLLNEILRNQNSAAGNEREEYYED